jgi:hypothetical protein
MIATTAKDIAKVSMSITDKQKFYLVGYSTAKFRTFTELQRVIFQKGYIVSISLSKIKIQSNVGNMYTSALGLDLI